MKITIFQKQEFWLVDVTANTEYHLYEFQVVEIPTKIGLNFEKYLP